MVDVFISYARASEARARLAVNALVDAGYAVWWDQDLLPHDTFGEETEERLGAAKAILVLWSEPGVRSQWVRAEAEVGRTTRKLIQASLDGATPPLPFRQVQVANLADWNGDPAGPAWGKVLASVAHLTGKTSGPAAAAPEPRPRKVRQRAGLLGLATVVLLLLAGVAAWRYWPGAPAAEPKIAIEAFRVVGADPAAKAFSDRLADDIAGVFGEHGAGLVLSNRDSAAAAAHADLVLGGTVSHEAGTWRVRAQLQDRRAGAVLWSDVYERPDEAALRDQVAVAVTETAITALDPLRQPGLRLDPRTMGLYLRATEGMKSANALDRGAPVRAIEEVVRRAPSFVTARAYLASALIGLASRSSGDDALAIGRRAKTEADRAIRMNPHLADGGYVALSGLHAKASPLDLVGSEDILLQGLANMPESPWLNMSECRFLDGVGRAREAVGYCARALSIRPLAAPLGHSYARALLTAGDRDLAQAAMARYVRYHPDSIQTRVTRFDMAAFEGSPDEALKLLQDGATRPQTLPSQADPALRAFLDARRAPTPAKIDAPLSAMRAAEAADAVDRRYYIFSAATLGRLDAALTALAPPARIESEILLSPILKPLRMDQRFWRLLAADGLVRYWRARNRWPDFCSEPGFDCRAAATQAGG
jgi:TolB-like protein